MTLIPGDGIGPELTTRDDAAWSKRPASTSSGRSPRRAPTSSTSTARRCREHVLDSVRKNKVAIKGPITTPVGTGFRSVNVAIRKELDLYTCLRPAFSIPGTGARYDDIDIVIVRENTEDLYAGIEFERGQPTPTLELIKFAADSGAGIIRPRLRHLAQADLDHRHASASSDTRSTTPSPTAARRSPRCIRPTSSRCPTACS